MIMICRALVTQNPHPTNCDVFLNVFDSEALCRLNCLMFYDSLLKIEVLFFNCIYCW
jgi:hypothetical protein